MKLNLKYLQERLKEFGTWKLIIAAILGVGGITLTDGQLEIVLALISAALAAWEAFVPSDGAAETKLLK